MNKLCEYGKNNKRQTISINRAGLPSYSCTSMYLQQSRPEALWGPKQNLIWGPQLKAPSTSAPLILTVYCPCSVVCPLYISCNHYHDLYWLYWLLHSTLPPLSLRINPTALAQLAVWERLHEDEEKADCGFASLKNKTTDYSSRKRKGKFWTSQISKPWLQTLLSSS